MPPTLPPLPAAASIVACICWNRAAVMIGPNVAGSFNPVIPVFGTLFAVSILGEPLRHNHLGGFALVPGDAILTSQR